MAEKNLTAWFMEEGVVAIPRNIIGLMEPLGLDFEDLGRIAYLLYCGCGNISKDDQYSYQAATALRRKGLIEWYSDIDRVDFTPMFNIIAENLGAVPDSIPHEVEEEEYSYSEFIKDLEKAIARFLSVRDKVELQRIEQRYSWSYQLIKDMYIFYDLHFRRQYSFAFFCQMAFGSQVVDKDSFMLFIENLNYTVYKVTEIKRRLGHRNSPTEIEKECYLKWINEWKFTHEMVHCALEQTLSATDPSFKYVDSILHNWQKQGVKNPEDVQNHNKQRRINQQTKKARRNSNQNVYGNIRNLDDLVE